MTTEQTTHLQNALKADATLKAKAPQDLLAALSALTNPMAGVTVTELQAQVAAITKEEMIQAFRNGAQDGIRLLQLGGTWDQAIAAVRKPA